MIIPRIRPLANDHLEGPATCKWSPGGSALMQMIIRMIRPFAKDHLKDPASCKWSTGGISLLQMIIRHPLHPSHLSQDTDSISRAFLEQFVLVVFVAVFVFVLSWSSIWPELGWKFQALVQPSYSGSASRPDLLSPGSSAHRHHHHYCDCYHHLIAMINILSKLPVPSPPHPNCHGNHQFIFTVIFFIMSYNVTIVF